ncbi:MAG: hypothetical protein EBV03_04095 [Proteobacteria bacterium]|nr:hypothetical protein [Pseudomonadota bacterium]
MKPSTALITGFASHATLSEKIIPPVADKAIVIENISVTSDKSSSVITFLEGGAPGSLTANAAANATSITVSASFAATISTNDVVYIFNRATKTGEIRTISSKSGSTLSFSGGLAIAYSAVDAQVFELGAAGTIPVGNATKEFFLSPGVLTKTAVGRPLVIRVDSTSAGKINHLLGRYID